MPDTTNVQDDLGYVRDVVRRSEHSAFPSAIAYLWAVIGVIGFALIDLDPERVGIYWIVAGPAGFLISMWLGWRQGRAVGQQSARDSRAHIAHWGALLITIFLLTPLIASGSLRGEAIAQVIILILALVYFLASIHMAPALKWAALAMALGYVVTVTMDRFAWTALGVLFAVGLVVSARVAGGGRGHQQA